MSFQELNIKEEYRSLVDNVSKNFYYPILKNALSYDRAVGFFSSSALIAIADGLIPFVKNGGQMRLIASPKLSDEDIKTIEKGYKLRDEVVKSAVMRELYEPVDEKSSTRLNLLANLIADSRLNIKIAITEYKGKIGMYHEKMGVFKDTESNIIAFSGSMNETITAMSLNYESIDVYCSWKNVDDEKRVINKVQAFEKLWNDKASNISVKDFPEVKESIIEKYKKEIRSYDDFNQKDFNDEIEIENKLEIPENVPQIPDNFNLYNYQIEAIEEWAKKDYCGIFDMATGTGKTYTALAAIVKLSQHLNNKLAVIIVCPYQHLVEQWVEDIVKFNIKPIIAYSTSPQKDWKEKLDESVRDQKLGVRGRKFFCLVTTNATYAGKYVQNKIMRIRGNTLLIVDEAHNFGASSLKNKLHDKFQYRLALSATLDRHNDEEGTQALYHYFGEKCIEYPLERAIKEGKLTKYKYYPRIVSLAEEELEKYNSFTKEIIKCVKINKKGKREMTEKGKRLAIARARIVAGAINKISQLKEDIMHYVNDNHILVYCGATRILSNTEENSGADEEDIRQIDCVTNMLGNELNMKVSKFTSEEDMNERRVLKKEFSEGKNLQALIAIKCLDEGVNIPSIKTAFILASTTNPKEYIQRRGRVLRLSKGKEFAEIYDYIILPRPLNEVPGLTEDERKKELHLVKNELSRAEEFARLAYNSIESNSTLDDIRDTYDLFNVEFQEDGINE
ncbi:DEAD/DEAH box helicase family protein [Clostridium ragsdalei]|uniref:DEAD/DEAH box helicase family protein n=1 Tax=Clostridium ragsdalei TaxID=217158 RepID=UPI0007EE8918|nr:DEAD/DEAH box helicase family protein [Clostridium ragsdalei]